MSTTFANSINSNPIYADRAENDKDGNRIDTTYAKSANLATVATSGDYSDLSNTPTIPAAQVQSDYSQSDNTAVDYIKNKPDLSIYAQSANLATVATSGSYNDLTNQPTIRNVPASTSLDATKVLTVDANGDPEWAAPTGLFEAVYGTTTYADIAAAVTAKKIVYCRITPNAASRMAFLAYIGSDNFEFQYYRSVSSHSASQQGDQVFVYKVTNADVWSTTTREAATKIVAGTHMNQSYSSGTLTLNADWPTVDQTYDGTSTDAQSGVAIEGKLADYTPTASLATVATSGDYSDLTNTPTIPAAQQQSDWSEVDSTAVTYIANKPVAKTLVAGTGITITETANSIIISLT